MENEKRIVPQEKMNKTYIRRIYHPDTGKYTFICGTAQWVSKDRDMLTRGATLMEQLEFHAKYNIKDCIFDPKHGEKLKARKEREKQIAAGTYNPFN